MSEPAKKSVLELDLSYLRDVASGSEEFMIEMIDMFLEQTPGYIAQMKQDIREKNWQQVADVAHKIKPTLAFMGAESARQDMVGIESRARKQENVEEIEGDFDKILSICDDLYDQLRNIRAGLNPEG